MLETFCLEISTDTTSHVLEVKAFCVRWLCANSILKKGLKSTVAYVYMYSANALCLPEIDS